MIHPALHLVLRHPELLAEHGSAYAALLAAGLSQDGRRLKRQLLCQLGALALAAVGAVLAGLALMLWSEQVWVWVLVPAVPLVGTLSATLITGEWPHWQDYLAVLFVMAAIAAVLIPPRYLRRTA